MNRLLKVLLLDTVCVPVRPPAIGCDGVAMVTDVCPVCVPRLPLAGVIPISS